MKFYTLERYDAWYTYDEEGDIVPLQDADREYTGRIESLRGVLSPDLIELATLEHVDDALIVEAHYSNALKRLTLVLRCGDLQVGYFDLVLTYKDAFLREGDLTTIARLARARSRFNSLAPSTGQMRRLQRKSINYLRYTPDLYRYELDVTEDGLIEHRFLFHPRYWFAIRCKSLEWEKIDNNDRDFPDPPNRFTGVPELYPPHHRKSKRANHRS